MEIHPITTMEQLSGTAQSEFDFNSQSVIGITTLASGAHTITSTADPQFSIVSGANSATYRLTDTGNLLLATSLAGTDFTFNAGGGTGDIKLTGADTDILWITDGGGNIGASGATRPTNIWATTNITAGGVFRSGDGTLLEPAFGRDYDANGSCGMSFTLAPITLVISTEDTGRAVFSSTGLGLADAYNLDLGTTGSITLAAASTTGFTVGGTAITDGVLTDGSFSFGATTLNNNTGDWSTTGDLTIDTDTLHVSSTYHSVGIGAAAVSTALVNIADTREEADNFNAITGSVVIDPTVTDKNYGALNFVLAIGDGVNDRTVDLTNLKAVSTTLTVTGQITGTITNAVGYETLTTFNGTAKKGPKTITSLKHFCANKPTLGVGITVDDQYGLFLEDMSDASGGTLTRGWSIYSLGGDSSHLGNVRIGGVAAVVPTDALEVVGVSVLGDGGAANYTAISATGDLTFVGTSGLVFGSFYGNNIAWSSVAFGGGGTFVTINTLTVGANINNMSFQNAQELLTSVVGKYLVTWALSGEAAGANKHIEVALGINGTANVEGRNHFETGHAGEEYAVSGTAILALGAPVLLSLMVTNVDDNTQIDVHHVNLTCVQVGG